MHIAGFLLEVFLNKLFLSYLSSQCVTLVLLCLFGRLLSFGYSFAALRSGLGLAAFFEIVADQPQLNLTLTYYVNTLVLQSKGCVFTSAERVPWSNSGQ